MVLHFNYIYIYGTRKKIQAKHETIVYAFILILLKVLATKDEPAYYIDRYVYT